MISGKKVLVTGATGFVGGRLVEKLVLYHGAHVRALVRNFTHASGIARFPIEMMGGDIAAPDAVDGAMEDCEIVFHCAHDLHNPQNNLVGAQVLAEGCLRHRVRCLVHVSSLAVYEPTTDGDLDESAPAEPSGWEYADNKLAVERAMLQYVEQYGLPVVVMQPTIVYGPFSKPWTIAPVKQLRTGWVVLPDSGTGLCNAVYVDDVVDALILAAEREEALGERFLVSGPEPVTWREFFGAYERILGVQSVISKPIGEIERVFHKSGAIHRIMLFMRNPYAIVKWAPIKPLYRFVRQHIDEAFLEEAMQRMPTPLYMPDEQELALYRAHTRVRIDKARRVLGYRPAFDFEQGVRLTAQYIRWANL